METIAIAGATGVLGQALIPLLLENGFAVRALVRNPSKAKRLFSYSVEIIECDLLASGIEVRLPFLLTGCYSLLHLATAIPKNRKDSETWERNTLLRTDGTRNLLKAAIQSGIKQYIQQSIVIAYPDNGAHWITEETKLDNSEKRQLICKPVIDMEQQVRRISPDFLHWCILRGGIFVGPGTFQDDLIKQLKSGTELQECDGQYYFSPVHVNDIAQAFLLAIKKSKSGSIYNINDEPITRFHYLRHLSDILKAPDPKTKPELPCPASHRCSNIKARLELGWKPNCSIYPKLN